MDKKISFFWGNDTMSWLRYMTLWTFRKLNPDWEMRLFVCDQQRSEKYWESPEQQDFFRYKGPDHSDKLDDIFGLQILPWEVSEPSLLSAGPSHKSNWFKWELLSKESGVYADLDIVFVKPIDEWHAQIGRADAAFCHRHAPFRYFSIGLLGSSGHGRFYRDVYESSVRGFGTAAYQSAGVMSLYRLFGPMGHPGHLAKIRQRYPNMTFANFPMNCIYPWDCNHVADMTNKVHTQVPNVTFGIHWYAGHDLAQKLNSELNEKTVKTHQSTVAHFLREML